MGQEHSKYSFDAQGRLKYHPDIHTNHGMPWKTSEQNYLIEHYETIGPDQISLELGRTIHTVAAKAYELRKKGLMKKPERRRNFRRNEGFK